MTAPVHLSKPATQLVLPTIDPKAKEKGEHKKETHTLQPVPLVTANHKILAAIAMVSTTPLQHATYKRQNDEKNKKSKPTHKQANLNIQIDEQTLMFT